MTFNTRSLKTEAIVLKKRDLLNKDVLISVFSQDFGRITLFAKGVKKITSRRSPHIQTGNLLNVLVSHKNDHYYLQETELLSGFAELKKDDKKIKQLYSFLFVLDRILPEQQKEAKIYNLTKNFFIDLSKKANYEKVIIDYLNEIMKHMGYSDKKLSRIELKNEIEEIINEKIPLLTV